MDKGRSSFLARPAFAALLFGLGVALFSPPALGIPAGSGNAALWLYLFAAWAGLIAVLAAVARAHGPDSRRPPPPPPQPGEDA
ncbi:MAG: hypothetical protein AB1916_06635 [Thermodesulfobacteriota bacterium]